MRLTPSAVVAVGWTVRAALRTSRTLRRRPLDEVVVQAPRWADLSQLAAVEGALIRLRASCLVRCLVVQAWLRACQHDRTLHVGVTSPAAGFRAHAWLDGEDPAGCVTLYCLPRRPADNSPVCP